MEAAARAVVREARVGDLPACAAIANAYIDETAWLPRVHSAEEVSALFEPGLLDRRRLLVAEEGGRVVGYLSLDPEAAKVMAIYLASGARGAGTGKAMMDRAKALSPAGLVLDCFETNTGAQDFYRREGFTEDPAGRRAETDEGIPTLMFRWEGRA